MMTKHPKDPQIEQVHAHHEEIVKGFKEQMKPVLDYSAQPVLLYLDDMHKTANKKFVELLGYKTVSDFEKTDDNFVETYIDEDSQETVVNNFHGPFRQEMKATLLSITIKTLAGKRIPVRFIHVPMTFQGHVFAVSFLDID